MTLVCVVAAAAAAARNIRRGTTCRSSFVVRRRIVPTLRRARAARAFIDARPAAWTRSDAPSRRRPRPRARPRARASGDAGTGCARGVRGVIARENRRGSPRGGVSRPRTSLGAMTKFGERLDAEAVPAWREHYVRYTHHQAAAQGDRVAPVRGGARVRPEAGPARSAAPPLHCARSTSPTSPSRSRRSARARSPGPTRTPGARASSSRELDADVDRVRARAPSELAGAAGASCSADADVADAARRGLPDLAARSDAELRRDAARASTPPRAARRREGRAPRDRPRWTSRRGGRPRERERDGGGGDAEG